MGFAFFPMAQRRLDRTLNGHRHACCVSLGLLLLKLVLMALCLALPMVLMALCLPPPHGADGPVPGPPHGVDGPSSDVPGAVAADGPWRCPVDDPIRMTVAPIGCAAAAAAALPAAAAFALATLHRVGRVQGMSGADPHRNVTGHLACGRDATP